MQLFKNNQYVDKNKYSFASLLFLEHYRRRQGYLHKTELVRVVEKIGRVGGQRE